MLEALGAPPGALVVMDRGVATETSVQWLRDHGYRYLVVSRERQRRFDPEAAVAIQTRSRQTVHLHRVVSTDPDEVRLYCCSEERANKEQAIVERFAARFEAALTQLNAGLARPRTRKRLDQVWQRIGRLKTKHSTRTAGHLRRPRRRPAPRRRAQGPHLNSRPQPFTDRFVVPLEDFCRCKPLILKGWFLGCLNLG